MPFWSRRPPEEPPSWEEMFPLEAISERGAEFHAALSAKLRAARDSGALSSGLEAQYEQQLKHIAIGNAACELISFPGFLSYPSACTSLLSHVVRVSERGIHRACESV